MMRVAAIVCVAALCGCQASTPSAPARAATKAPTDASLVLPGSYSQRTTVADFEAQFGTSNVRIVQDPGEPHSRSVVLFPDDPTRRAYATFHDAEGLNGLAGISVTDADSLWRGKHGVRVGMSFAALRALNGKPFGFSGFDGERRGYAHDQWSPALDGDDGRLGALDVDEGEHMYFGVDLGLREPVAASDYPADEWLSSDDPRFPRLGELVVVTGFNATTSLDDEWE